MHAMPHVVVVALPSECYMHGWMLSTASPLQLRVADHHTLYTHSNALVLAHLRLS